MPKAVHCRCILYVNSTKRIVDLRCGNRTENKNGICGICISHRREDLENERFINETFRVAKNSRNPYAGRWGLARMPHKKL